MSGTASALPAGRRDTHGIQILWLRVEYGHVNSSAPPLGPAPIKEGEMGAFSPQDQLAVGHVNYLFIACDIHIIYMYICVHMCVYVYGGEKSVSGIVLGFLLLL